MQKYYPEVYFPEKLIHFNKNWQSIIAQQLTQETIVKPEKPNKPEKNEFNILTFAFLPLLFSVFVYLIFQNTTITLFFIASWVVIYSSLFITDRLKYQKKVEVFQQDLNKYLADLNNFEKVVKSQKTALSKIGKKVDETDFGQEKRYEYINNLLKNVEKANVAFDNPRKGSKEAYFRRYLRKYFGGAIKTDKTLEIFHSSNRAYIPDFIFEHPKSNLVLDIEIDEPYTGIDKKPIHYYNNSNDRQRNSYFLEKDWIVIRFSEEQIVNAPKSCCKEIASIIFDLTGDATYLKKLIVVNRLYRHSKWKLKEVEALINKNYRNNYSKPTLFFEKNTTANLVGKWLWMNKRVEFRKDNKIVEFSTTNKVRAISDYKIIETEIGQVLIITGKAKAKFILEDLNSEKILMTNFHSRKYIELKKHEK